jgi:adenylate cyclase
VLVLYLMLTLPGFGAMVAITYLSNDETARDDAKEMVERFRADTIENFQERLTAIKSLVRSAAAAGAEHPEFYRNDSALGYLFSVLSYSDKLVSAYVGLEDGSFRQARRMDANTPVNGSLPPSGTRYAYRRIDPAEPAGGARRLDHYVFLDAERRELGRASVPTNYDPRSRLWYASTQLAGRLHVTEPDVFFALGLIGFTVAAPVPSADGALQGIVAIDLTLDGLSAYLHENGISPRTRSYLLDHRGRVVANSDARRTWTNEGGRVALQHVAELSDDALGRAAYDACSRAEGTLCPVRFGGRDYIASLTRLPSEFGQPWQLFTVTPVDDFTAQLRANNERLLLFGLAALLVQVAVIYFAAAVISAPLERLAVNVRRIQDLEPHGMPALESPIREIAVLSRAVGTLDAFVKSFATYVPVGLVRQLLESGRRPELGGSSRFLTIFFSDIEGFSGLSEALPAQELMLRVSAYLEVVIRAVDEERGTIDKFIGDGVMAFWGAPALLEDHARRACLAALRVQAGMRALNARWEAEEQRPLHVRIGIHSDAVLVGNIGAPTRMSYTVLGDGVNVAARLEGANKAYGTRICISHGVFKEAGERLCARPVDEIAVRGRRARTPVYELLGAHGMGAEFEPDEATLRLCRMTHLAYDAMAQGDTGLALERYRETLAIFPDDPVCRAMIRKLTGQAPAPEFATERTILP